MRPWTLLIIGVALTAATVRAFLAPFPGIGGNPVLDLIAYHDPGLHTAIHVWYYAAPAVALLLAGSVCLSVTRVWLEPRTRRGARGKLPAWPTSPGDDSPALVVGELHHPTVPRESERPSWLVVPETGLYTGVLIVGAVGTGKTTACMYPFARQIQARGGQVRKGERGTRILSFEDHRKIAVTDARGRPATDNEGKRIYRYERLSKPFVRQYTVFNAEQADGLPARSTPTPEPLWKTHQEAERVLEDSGVPVRHVAGDRAYYHMNRDEVVLPERGQFPSANHYYQTALHELGHSTGHPERMNRETLVEGIKTGFGSPDYAKEELRAEISAMMTGERVGVGHDPSRGAAYVEGWIAALEEDPREIRRAAADAQKISDFVLVRHIEREAAREPVAVAASRAPGPQRTQVPVPPLPVPERSSGPSR